MFSHHVLIRDIGTYAAALCQHISHFCDLHRTDNDDDDDDSINENGGNGNAGLRLMQLICMATHFAPAAGPAATVTDLADEWYAHMRSSYEELVSKRIAEDEEAAEIRSLFREGVCAGREVLKSSEITGLFKTCSDMCGVPALMHIDWASFAEPLLKKNNNNGQQQELVSTDAAVAILLRGWADATISPSSWWTGRTPMSKKRVAAAARATTQVHSIAYSVSPYLRLRFRVSFPELVDSQRTDDSGGRVVRDLVLTFDDDDIMPGQTLAPVTKQWRELCSFYGLSEATLQKALVHLQKLVARSMAGEFLGTSKASGVQPVQGHLDTFGSPSRVEPSPKKSFLSPKKEQQSAAAPAEAKKAKSSGGGEPEQFQKGSIRALYRNPETALKDVDLQTCEDETIRAYKEKMDEQFSSNKLKPGDEGYVYDKRVDVAPTKTSAWDSDSD